jgi:hypothetical protein
MNAYDISETYPAHTELNEAAFDKLVLDFEMDYLERKDFAGRLAVHRNPTQVQQEILRDLNTLILQIQARPEMRDIDPEKNAYGHVPSKIKEIWESDKRIKSMYDAATLYCKYSQKEFTQIALHFAEFQAANNLFGKINRTLSQPDNTQHITKMPDKFKIKRVEQSGIPPYLKVYFQAGIDLASMKHLLHLLPSVRTVNISNEKTGKPDLTVYPAGAYDIADTEKEVDQALTAHFAGSLADPAFHKEPISILSDRAYIEILDHILICGKNLESSPRLNSQLNEETSRDYFVMHLNSLSSQYGAKGEVFNRKGKTDILVFNHTGDNIFIGECKFWNGEAALSEAVDQLLDRYVNWRDERTALIIFNQTAQNFSAIIEKAVKCLKNHPRSSRYLGMRRETSYSFLFQHPVDETRTVKLELILFNFA